MHMAKAAEAATAQGQGAYSDASQVEGMAEGASPEAQGQNNFFQTEETPQEAELAAQIVEAQKMVAYLKATSRRLARELGAEEALAGAKEVAPPGPAPTWMPSPPGWRSDAQDWGSACAAAEQWGPAAQDWGSACAAEEEWGPAAQDWGSACAAEEEWGPGPAAQDWGSACAATEPQEWSSPQAWNCSSAAAAEESPSSADAWRPLPTLDPDVTTLVVRNVPCSQEELLETWPPDGSYNFLYRPIGIEGHKVPTHAFVNFTSREAAVAFQAKWHGKFLHNHGMDRALDIAGCVTQGYEMNLKRALKRPGTDADGNLCLPALFRGVERVDTREEAARLGLQAPGRHGAASSSAEWRRR